MGFSFHNENQINSTKYKKYSKETSPTHAAVIEGVKCHVCDKEGHVVVTTAKGNKVIPYYVCMCVFVNMSPLERFSKLKSKHLCIKYIFPGASKA